MNRFKRVCGSCCDSSRGACRADGEDSERIAGSEDVEVSGDSFQGPTGGNGVNHFKRGGGSTQ